MAVRANRQPLDLQRRAGKSSQMNDPIIVIFFSIFEFLETSSPEMSIHFQVSVCTGHVGCYKIAHSYITSVVGNYRLIVRSSYHASYHSS